MCQQPEKKEKLKSMGQSTTVPESGLFVEGEYRRQFTDEAHTGCDANGFVQEIVVTPGNIHNSVAFDDVYDKVTRVFPEIAATVVDSIYKTPYICKKVFDDKRVLFMACRRPQAIKSGRDWWKYVYDEYNDCVHYQGYQILLYSTINRDRYWE